MIDSYVCSGAIMRCSCGTSQAKLTVLPIRTVFLTGQPMANISDHLSFVNLGAFGLCRSLGFPNTALATANAHGKLTPRPCMHNTPYPWMGGKNDYIVRGEPALLRSSTCSCMWGGIISIVNDGQRVGDISVPPIIPHQNFNTEFVEEGALPLNTLRGENKPGRQMINRQIQHQSNSPYRKMLITAKRASLVLKDFDHYSDNKKNGILRGANALPDSIPIDERLKLAEHTTVIAKALNMSINSPMTIEQADKQSANPNFKAGNDYSINCATAAATYALRLQGLNLTAKSKNSQNKLNVWLSKGNSFKVWKNLDGTDAKPLTYKDWMRNHTINKKPITQMTPGLYKRFIEDYTKEEGVYIITVGWKTGGGHATIIQRWRDEKGNLQLSYIEPQVYNKKAGVKHSIDELVANMDADPLPARGIMRVDNKKFDIRYISLFEKPNENSRSSNKSGSKPNRPVW